MARRFSGTDIIVVCILSAGCQLLVDFDDDLPLRDGSNAPLAGTAGAGAYAGGSNGGSISATLGAAGAGNSVAIPHAGSGGSALVNATSSAGTANVGGTAAGGAVFAEGGNGAATNGGAIGQGGGLQGGGVSSVPDSSGIAGSQQGSCGGIACTDPTPYCLSDTCVACRPTIEECSANGQRRCNSIGSWEPISLNFDARHCGACHHDCIGGSCSAGMCQKFAIAASQIGAPNGITIDESYVYYTCPRDGEIRRVSNSGGYPELIASNRAGWPTDIVHVAGQLYFAEGEFIYRLKADGSEVPIPFYSGVRAGGTTIEIETDYGQPGVSATSATVIWSDPTYVLQDLVTSSGYGTYVELGGPGQPGGVAIDKNLFFWSRLGSGISNGYVMACKRAGCSSSQVVIAENQPHPEALFFDGSHLYWANAGQDDETTTRTDDVIAHTGSILRSKFESGTNTWSAPEPVVSGIDRPFDMLVDAQWVYWTSTDAGTVSKAAKDGGSEVPLATGESAPWYLTQDASSLYWTNAILNGNVMRIAK